MAHDDLGFDEKFRVSNSRWENGLLQCAATLTSSTGTGN
jgi:hypothetical protein